MALVPSLSKPLASSRGALGKLADVAIKGLGGGAAVNVADKVILQGRMTGIGVTLPFTLPGMTAPLRFNLTDVAYFWLINGLKVPKGRGALWVLAGLGLKKVGEGKGWIDPPEWGYSSAKQTSGTSTTQETMPMISTGGLTGR